MDRIDFIRELKRNHIGNLGLFEQIRSLDNFLLKHEIGSSWSRSNDLMAEVVQALGTSRYYTYKSEGVKAGYKTFYYRTGLNNLYLVLKMLEGERVTDQDGYLTFVDPHLTPIATS